MNNNNNNNNNNNKYDMPSVAPTPSECYFDTNPFMFEVSEQRRQKINRDIFLQALKSVVDDIVALYSSFKNKDDNKLQYRRIMGTVKGYEYAQMIVDFIEMFKISLPILRSIQIELLEVIIENATYKSNGSPGSTPQIMCKTKSSIVGFEPVVINNISDNPFSTLKCRIESMIIETIKLGKGVSSDAVWYAHSSAKDGISYSSNEEHAQIWEYKKTFSSRLLNATVVYVESLMQNN